MKDHAMTKPVIGTAALLLVTVLGVSAHAQSLTPQQARAIVAPLYDALNDVRGRIQFHRSHEGVS
jgi:hypothetical protein